MVKEKYYDVTVKRYSDENIGIMKISDGKPEMIVTLTGNVNFKELSEDQARVMKEGLERLSQG